MADPRIAAALAMPPGSLWAALEQFLPTPARLYIDSVLKGKKEPITEADFSKEELAAIRDLITASNRSGGVRYSDYGNVGPTELPGLPGLLTAKGRVSNALGQFDYKKDPEGTTTVTDQYAFSPYYKNMSAIHNVAAALGTAGFAPLHLLGEHVIPQGQGRPVKIRLP